MRKHCLEIGTLLLCKIVHICPHVRVDVHMWMCLFTCRLFFPVQLAHQTASVCASQGLRCTCFALSCLYAGAMHDSPLMLWCVCFWSHGRTCVNIICVRVSMVWVCARVCVRMWTYRCCVLPYARVSASACAQTVQDAHTQTERKTNRTHDALLNKRYHKGTVGCVSLATEPSSLPMTVSLFNSSKCYHHHPSTGCNMISHHH